MAADRLRAEHIQAANAFTVCPAYVPLQDQDDVSAPSALKLIAAIEALYYLSDDGVILDAATNVQTDVRWDRPTS